MLLRSFAEQKGIKAPVLFNDGRADAFFFGRDVRRVRFRVPV
jgi:hypothetical protein